MVIGISPTLIMTLVGSLLFFLLTVFYRGQHEARLMYIFALFVMAIVLIARISMEEGIEYATLFAVPLGIVTAIAMVRFVEFRGQAASMSLMINLTLMALIWWSAHKLTWDCTLIDDRQDSSGEGLLQGMGFTSQDSEDSADSRRSPNAVAEPEMGAAAIDPAATPAAAQAGRDDHLPLWWRRMLDRRKRPHTPGVWVVYYSMVALTLFGIGQTFIPASNAAARLSAFRYLFVYVASALGLLLTTSFLGLRRYLRQRGLQMPGDMAGLWLGLGSIMILALLLFCVLLPRPGAELKVSQVPFQVGSPEHRRTHSQALGNDGPQRPEQATATRSIDQNPPDPPAPTAHGNNASSSSEQSQPANSQTTANQRPGDSDARESSPDRTSSPPSDKPSPSDATVSNPSPRQASQANSQRSAGDTGNADNQSSTNSHEASPAAQRDNPGDSSARGSGEKQTGDQRSSTAKTNDQSQSGTHSDSTPGRSSAEGSGQPSGRSERATPSASSKESSSTAKSKQGSSDVASGTTGNKADSSSQQTSPQKPSPDNQPSTENSAAAPENAQGSPRQPPASSTSPASGQESSSRGSSGQSKAGQSSPKTSASGESSQARSFKEDASRESATQPTESPASQPTSFAPTRFLPTLTSGIGTLFKLIFWGALLGFLTYFAWKHRDRIWQAIEQLLDDLRNLWTRLFGSDGDAEAGVDTSAADQAASARPFASYPDPFLSGKAGRTSMEQLVRYSFEALEAWARERGCGRSLEQTPLEFAQRVSRDHPGLGLEVQTLADLYSRMAYGREPLGTERRSVLEQLWRHMRSTAAMPVPPVAGA